MVTFILAKFLQLNSAEVVGYVLMALESLLVLTKFIEILVPAESKFAKFLQRLLKGLNFVKKSVANTKDENSEKSDD